LINQLSPESASSVERFALLWRSDSLDCSITHQDGASVISVGWADLHGFRSSVLQRSLLGPKCGASARHLRNPIRLRLAARGSSDEDLKWARCGVSRRRLEPGGTGGRARCSALPNRRWTDGDAII